MKRKDSQEVEIISANGEIQQRTDIEAADNQPVLQNRFLSLILSKKVPHVPLEPNTTPYPLKRSNVLKRMFFWYMVPLFNIGYKRTLDDNDIWRLEDDQTVEYNTERFNAVFYQNIANWRRKHPNKGPNEWPTSLLIRSVLSPFYYRTFMAIVFCFGNEFAAIGAALVSKSLIQFVEDRSADRSIPINQGIAFTFALVAMNLVDVFAYNHMTDYAMRFGIDAKSVLIKKCFEKSLKLSRNSQREFPTSKIATIIGNDLSRFEYSFAYLIRVLTTIVGLIVVIAMLIVNLGVSSLAGILLLVVTCGFQGWGSERLYVSRSKVNVFTDKRVNYVHEILSNFKILKFYNWEFPYFDRIRKIRESEMKLVLNMKFLRCGIEAGSISLPIISTMISFVIFYKVRGITDIAAIFSSLQLFNILASEVSAIPRYFSTASDAYSAMKRMNGLLQCEEMNEQTSTFIENSTHAISVKDGDFVWGLTEENSSNNEDSPLGKHKKQQLKEAYELQSIISHTNKSVVSIDSVMQTNFDGLHKLNFSIKKGEFIIVTGLIGCGKTSLLNAIAGNMNRVKGELEVNDSMLFCGTPWVQNTTIRENILFGSAYDPEKYKRIINSCALADDLKVLEYGDATEVGDRGVTLSGGQKARINLARAVYADASILLMDDVLSAVDAKVGEHIVQNCFLNLLKTKTRVLATHQLSLISAADKILFLSRDGTADFERPDVLKERNEDFARLLSYTKMVQTEHVSEDLKESEEHFEAEARTMEVAAEEKAVNSLEWPVYKAFLFAGDGWLRFLPSVLFVFSLSVTVFSQQFSSVWLSFWTEQRFDSLPAGAYMGLYIFFNLLCVFATLAYLVALSWLVNNASKNLALSALKKVLHAPVSFMDTTPIGRVLNRFTRDTDVLDNEIYQDLEQMMSQGSQLIGVLVLSFVYLPWLCISIPFLFVICICLSDYSQSTGRESKRIEALRRSFVFNNINETLEGLATIKAYNSENRFLEKNNYYTNRTTASQYITISSQRWLAIEVGLISVVFGFMISMMAITRVFHLSGSSLGVLLSAMLTFNENLSTLFQSALMVENSMNSAERLYQYSSKLIQEAPDVISEFRPSPSWPSSPSIDFQNVSMAYRKGLPLVLRDLSFSVKAREKIGICGRTGAGKSSIMNSLFRITELQNGKIIIDGIDISKIGLADLRSKLSIIPQETVMFKGTIRYNLDPFGEKTDGALWEALRKSGLGEDVITEDSKFHLDAIVEDNGSNYSLGEKQLIALARALARESNILILDEATSSVDYETDSKIQSTIRDEFNDCTILCIAHRLRTILQYDRILVLDAGEVKEFDTPYALFCKENGLFKEMCQSSKITAADFEL